MNCDQCIVHSYLSYVNKIGIKKCYRVVTNKQHTILVGASHRFYVGNGVYKELCDLRVGDTIYVHNNTKFTGKAEHVPIKIRVGFHPNASLGQISKGNGLEIHPAIANHEASLNHMDLDEYIGYLNTESQRTILNTIDFVPASEYNKIYALANRNKLLYIVVPDEIKSIESVGQSDMYRIGVGGADFFDSNYIVNKIVVSNFNYLI